MYTNKILYTCYQCYCFSLPFRLLHSSLCYASAWISSLKNVASIPLLYGQWPWDTMRQVSDIPISCGWFHGLPTSEDQVLQLYHKVCTLSHQDFYVCHFISSKRQHCTCCSVFQDNMACGYRTWSSESESLQFSKLRKIENVISLDPKGIDGRTFELMLASMKMIFMQSYTNKVLVVLQLSS